MRRATAQPADCTAWARRVTIPTGTAGKREVSPAAAKSVLVLMASYAWPNGANIHPGAAELAAELELSPRTVRAAIRRLEELGLLTQVKCPAKHRNAEFTLVMGPVNPGKNTSSLREEPAVHLGENGFLGGQPVQPGTVLGGQPVQPGTPLGGQPVQPNTPGSTYSFPSGRSYTTTTGHAGAPIRAPPSRLCLPRTGSCGR